MLVSGSDLGIDSVVQHLLAAVGDRVDCLNVYGPTQASVTAIVHNLLERKSEKTNTVLIGCLIANTQAYILDRHLRQWVSSKALPLNGYKISSHLHGNCVFTKQQR